MLRKSVETRDWLNTIEPRTVRAVMKRVVEDITTMDVQVIAHHSLQIIPQIEKKRIQERIDNKQTKLTLNFNETQIHNYIIFRQITPREYILSTFFSFSFSIYQVGVFFEEGARKANSSDSSKWTHTYSQSRGTTGGGAGGAQRNQYSYGNKYVIT